MKRKPVQIQKAYKDVEFLNSPDARTVRILSEFLEPARRFRMEGIRHTIVFFGSARTKSHAEARQAVLSIEKKLRTARGKKKEQCEQEYEAALNDLEMSKYYEDCVELSRLLTEWSKKLHHNHRFVVCSGGGPGIMEAANKGAYLAKGRTIGLNISLPFEQYANRYISPKLNFEFHYFFMRKLWFVYLGKALVVFPGGFGTFDELMEVLTLLQTKKVHKKMTVLVYGRDYWSKIINFEELVRRRMIDPKDMKLFAFADTPKEAFDYLTKELTKNYIEIKSKKNDRTEK